MSYGVTLIEDAELIARRGRTPRSTREAAVALLATGQRCVVVSQGEHVIAYIRRAMDSPRLRAECLLDGRRLMCAHPTTARAG